MIKPLLQSLSAPLLLGTALAQAPEVAIVSAAAGVDTDCRFTDIQDKLMMTGLFGRVEIFDAFRGTPTLAELQGFDAVLTHSKLDYQSPDLIGDVFADYVDAGGGVVSAVFAMTTTDPDRRIGGRWVTGGYEVIEAGLDNLGTTASLGLVLDPSHPSMQGVTSLTATAAFRPLLSTGLVQGSVVAEWDDGAILVAQGAMPNRIDLGLYPPSNDCFGTFWDSTTDGTRLIANSLLATIGAATIGTSYCMPNVNATGAAGRMAAAGSSVVSDDNVTLTASSLPNFSFSFFLASRSQGFIMNPAGSAGNLCLGGMIGRYVGPGQVLQSNSSGEIALAISLAAIPQPLGFVAVQPGDTWNFQAWYRDVAGGVPTSNFTDGYTIAFQ